MAGALPAVVTDNGVINFTEGTHPPGAHGVYPNSGRPVVASERLRQSDEGMLRCCLPMLRSRRARGSPRRSSHTLWTFSPRIRFLHSHSRRP